MLSEICHPTNLPTIMSMTVTKEENPDKKEIRGTVNKLYQKVNTHGNPYS